MGACGSKHSSTHIPDSPTDQPSQLCNDGSDSDESHADQHVNHFQRRMPEIRVKQTKEEVTLAEGVSKEPDWAQMGTLTLPKGQQKRVWGDEFAGDGPDDPPVARAARIPAHGDDDEFDYRNSEQPTFHATKHQSNRSQIITQKASGAEHNFGMNLRGNDVFIDESRYSESLVSFDDDFVEVDDSVSHNAFFPDATDQNRLMGIDAELSRLQQQRHKESPGTPEMEQPNGCL